MSSILVLTRALLARFFESETSTEVRDIRSSFFWLIALLAPIGVLFPWFMIVRYSLIVTFYGKEALRNAVLVDKGLYLGWTVVVAAALSLINWSALTIDRRDALVLGPLPVAPRSFVAMAVSMVAWRLAAGTPGDVAAMWVFDLMNHSRTDRRPALRRALFAAGMRLLSAHQLRTAPPEDDGPLYIAR